VITEKLFKSKAGSKRASSETAVLEGRGGAAE
jgi:hypothetical protein